MKISVCVGNATSYQKAALRLLGGESHNPDAPVHWIRFPEKAYHEDIEVAIESLGFYCNLRDSYSGAYYHPAGPHRRKHHENQEGSRKTHP